MRNGSRPSLMKLCLVPGVTTTTCASDDPARLVGGPVEITADERVRLIVQDLKSFSRAILVFFTGPLGIAGLGGATLDNEENYLIKKLFTALGAIQIENQARI